MMTLFAIWLVGAFLTYLGHLIRAYDVCEGFKFDTQAVFIARRVIFWYIFIPAWLIDFNGEKK